MIDIEEREVSFRVIPMAKYSHYRYKCADCGFEETSSSWWSRFQHHLTCKVTRKMAKYVRRHI